MPKIPEDFEMGVRGDITNEDLFRAMEDMYRRLAVAINAKPDIIVRETDGGTSETFLSNGDININTSTDKVEMLTSRPSATTVTWTTLS